MRKKSMMASAMGAIAASLLLVGCSTGGTTDSGPVGTWGPVGDGLPQLVLAEDGALTGTDGCNNLVGAWTQEGDVIDFGEVASTMMFCEGVDTWLLTLKTGTVDGDTLTILDEGGATIGTLEKQ